MSPFGDPPPCAECGKWHWPQCAPTPKPGWECPRCRTIHNPATMTCFRCEPDVLWTPALAADTTEAG